jgi:hypothetical protein
MNIRLFLIGIVFITHFFSTATDTSAQSVRSLYSINEDVRFRAAPDEYHRSAIQINATLHEQPPQPGEIILVPIGSTSQAFRVTRVREFIPGIVSFTGVDPNGGSRYMAFSIENDRILGLMQLLPEAELYYITPQPETNGAVLARMRPDRMDILACGVDDATLPQFQLEQDHPLQRARRNLTGMRSLQAPGAGVDLGALVAGRSDRVTIDIMMVYTPNAENWALGSVGSIELAMAQAMNLSQQAIDDSYIHIELRLVHTHKLTYNQDDDNDITSSGVPSGTHLRRLSANPANNIFGGEFVGFMDEVHQLRNQYGVDMVSMLARVNDTGGLAWLLNNLAGVPELGFSLNRIQQSTNGYTVVHELGHNMGLAHGRQQITQNAGPFGGIHMYSAGWIFQATDPFSNNVGRPSGRHTVMSYSTNGSLQFPGFSNPDIISEGSPTGNVTDPIGPADAARSMRDIKASIAAYRPTMIAPPLKSVSTPGIFVSLEQGQSDEVSVSVANLGDSNMFWSAGVRPGSQEPSAVTAAEILAYPDTHIIYETGFEAVENFTLANDYITLNNFRSFNTTRFFQISGNNPAPGSSQHLRLAYLPSVASTAYAQVAVPLFERSNTSTISVEFDMAVNGASGSRYDIYAIDVSNGRIAAGLSIVDGTTIRGITTNTSGEEVFEEIAGLNLTPGVYRNYRMTLVPESGHVYFFADGALYHTMPITVAQTPDQINFYRLNGTNTSDYMDIDNLRQVRHFNGYSWLNFQQQSGATQPNMSGTIQFQVQANNKPAGLYEGAIQIHSNDPTQSTITIPVTMRVTDGPSTETVPTVISAGASNLGTNTASISAEITSDGNTALVRRGVCYALTPNPNLTDTCVTEDTTTAGPFSITLTGLEVGVTYYARPFATNTVGTGYGTVVAFTTVRALATVRTVEVLEVQPRSAVISAELVDQGSEPVTERGICFGTSENPDIEGTCTATTATTPAFTVTLSDLLEDTPYFARAYATSIAGTSYGEQISFRTTITIPETVELAQNYPNPFNPSTNIVFGIPTPSKVTLTVYDITGKRVVTLADGNFNAGNHTIVFNANALASGLYFYSLVTPDKVLHRKMLLVR